MAITLTGGMRANLFALQNTTKMMDDTQRRLATGKRINTALDDPVNFFKSKDHYDRAKDLSAKKDGMNEAIKVIESANTGIEGIYDLMDQMKSLASAAKTSSNDTDLQNQYDALRNQLADMASDSSYGGVNLLAGDDLSVEFNEDGSSSLSVAGFEATTAGAFTMGGTTYNISAADFQCNGTIENNISEIDAVVDQLRTEAQKLASSLSTIEIRADFTQEMINTLNTGADNLTLADMNEEGANMLMLQTRQQLGTTSLSMSSQAAQAVLRLF
jgi:flagellin-like hook-associated protein FlgL